MYTAYAYVYCILDALDTLDALDVLLDFNCFFSNYWVFFELLDCKSNYWFASRIIGFASRIIGLHSRFSVDLLVCKSSLKSIYWFEVEKSWRGLLNTTKYIEKTVYKSTLQIEKSDLDFRYRLQISTVQTTKSTSNRVKTTESTSSRPQTDLKNTNSTPQTDSSKPLIRLQKHYTQYTEIYRNIHIEVYDKIYDSSLKSRVVVVVLVRILDSKPLLLYSRSRILTKI